MSASATQGRHTNKERKKLQDENIMACPITAIINTCRQTKAKAVIQQYVMIIIKSLVGFCHGE